MGLETVTYISDLVETNPIGGTDDISEGDDHIRNIKKGIKATFPNIDGPVTMTQAQLNALPETGEDETITGEWDFENGLTVDGVNVGLALVPPTTFSGATTATTAHVDGLLYRNSGATDITLTIPSGDFAVGSVLMVYNGVLGEVTVSVTGGVTVRQDQSGDSGSFTLGQYGRAVLHKITSVYWTASVIGLA